MKKIAWAALLCMAAGACRSMEQGSRSSAVPEAWVHEAETRFSKSWEEAAPYLQQELFPCHLCFGFHGDVSEEGGPAHLVPDSRQAILCPLCQGTGHETCPTCGGRGRVICEVCKGFGIVRCPDCELVRIPNVPKERTGRATTSRSVGCPTCDFRGEDCPQCRVEVVDVERLASAAWNPIRYQSREPCPTCHSRGWLDCPYCRNGLRTCKTCNGTGYAPDPCPLCHGTGLIIPEHTPFHLERKRRRPDAE